MGAVSGAPTEHTDAVLLELDIPERSLQACLLDPFTGLLRGIDSDCTTSVTRPPTKPYIVSSTNLSPPGRASSNLIDPYNKPGSNGTRASASSSELPPIGFVGKARRKISQVVPKPEGSHHALIESDISAAIDAIRTRWIETEPLRGHAEWWAQDYEQSEKLTNGLARLKLKEKNINEASESGAPNWAEITRSSSQTGEL